MGCYLDPVVYSRPTPSPPHLSAYLFVTHPTRPYSHLLVFCACCWRRRLPFIPSSLRLSTLLTNLPPYLSSWGPLVSPSLTATSLLACVHSFSHLVPTARPSTSPTYLCAYLRDTLPTLLYSYLAFFLTRLLALQPYNCSFVLTSSLHPLLPPSTPSLLCSLRLPSLNYFCLFFLPSGCPAFPSLTPSTTYVVLSVPSFHAFVPSLRGACLHRTLPRRIIQGDGRKFLRRNF